MPTARYAHLYIDMYLLIFSSFFAAICSYKPVADDAADAELGDREKVEQLADDLGRRGDLRAEVIDQQPPRDQPQQQAAAGWSPGRRPYSVRYVWYARQFLSQKPSPEGEGGPEGRMRGEYEL